jgi:ATP-dependent Clp protease ATP-binding subunit ClpC
MRGETVVFNQGENRMQERFSERAQKVMAYANLEVNRLGNDHLGTEHLLLGLVREGKGNGAMILQALGVELAELAHEVERLTPKNAMAQTSKRPVAGETRMLIELAGKEAERLGDQTIGTEHLLLGMVMLPECPACKPLKDRGVTEATVAAEIQKRRGEGGGGGRE